MRDAPSSVSSEEKSWFGQPPGLTILFLTEMWEKFSFFGMRALLIYYMTKALGYDQPRASMIYGFYAAYVYFTPIVGGFLCDRWLGPRRAVLIGSAIMALGHAMMAMPSLFFPALFCIGSGSGLFLPSLPSQVLGLYRQGDPRRGSAFNIYFVGINLGAILSPLVCGTLGELYGWHFGFTAAAIGMCAGMAIYAGGGRLTVPRPDSVVGDDQPGTHDRDHTGLWRLMGVGAAVILFRGAYEQIGNTIALWADSDVDRQLFGLRFPASWVQAVDPLLIFLLTPLVVIWWTKQARHKREPGAISKMALGALGVAGSFLILSVASVVATGSGGKSGIIWLALYLTLFTASELFILPVGMGLFARMAPKGRNSLTMAGWFFCSFAGNILAGALGSLWSVLSHSVFFACMAAFAAMAAAILHLLRVRESTP